jgi:phosphate transport system permease protein
MKAYTPRGRQVTIHAIGPRDRLPDDPKLLNRTLRTDAEGGRISRESWYHLKLPFGRSVVAGGLTLMLVVLPIVIISTQEALRAVPGSLREGAFGLGATRLQMVRNVTLPAAIPGIMTGSILSISRAIGEAAPILMIAGIVYISASPQHLMDDFTVLPLQIYNWAQHPQAAFHSLAATGILVLLMILLTFNSLAIVIRIRAQKQLS